MSEFDIHHALAVTRELPNGVQWGTMVVALLHDATEDAGVTSRDMACFPLFVREAVVALARREGERYDDYIDRVAQDRLTALVKGADLRANIARADEDHASLLPRYERALHRLQFGEWPKF